ncbi:glycosyltransferase [Pikeienuella sp. HZG-20]|uniref:glycosyltransferase n=1 Tax=Paludibacillus litoralis TaxID=3133267 RepID=UPI0030EEA5D1
MAGRPRPAGGAAAQSRMRPERARGPVSEADPQGAARDGHAAPAALASERARLKARIAHLRERQARLTAEIETLKAAKQGQTDRVARLQAKLRDQRDRVARLQGKLQEQRDRVARMQGKLQEQRDRVARLQALAQDRRANAEQMRARLEIHRANAAQIRTRLQDQRAQAAKVQARLRGRLDRVAPNAPLNRFLAFAQDIGARAEECRADVYLAHGVEALPAADRLRALQGGAAACDVIEIPSFAARAILSKWEPTVLKTIDHALLGYLREADFALTVGWALGDIVSKTNADVRVVPNWRNHAELTVSNELREEFGLGPDAKVVLAISTIASGFEQVLEAFARMGGDVHLVVVGTFAPLEYGEQITALRAALGLESRVHFRGPVPYRKMIEYCGGADIGLIVRDPSIPNNYISLPNRVFDYLACGLPIVAPMMPDIDKILRTYDCGLSIDGVTAEAWADGVARALERRDEMRAGTIEASARMTWENLERDQLLDVFGRPFSVTFVGFNDLTLNNRTMRMATSLTRLGVAAKVACPMSETSTVPDGVIAIPFEKY